MANRSPVRTPTRLPPPQQGIFGYVRATASVTGSEERAQGLPGSAAVVRYRDSERGASSLPVPIIRLTGTQAGNGAKSSQARGLAASGTVGDGARAGAFALEPRLAPSRRCRAQRASEQAPRAPLALAVPGHWDSTLKVPTTVGAKERRRPPSSTRDRDATWLCSPSHLYLSN